MTVDLVVNVLLVLFISSNLAILYMSNIGYVLAHVLAVSGVPAAAQGPAELATTAGSSIGSGYRSRGS